MQKNLKKFLKNPSENYYFPAGVSKKIALHAINYARIHYRTEFDLYRICTDLLRIAFDGFWITNHGFGFWFDYSEFLPKDFQK